VRRMVVAHDEYDIGPLTGHGAVPTPFIYYIRLSAGSSHIPTRLPK
jgi:hypothetical protein